jgi:hypothetical protein
MNVSSITSLNQYDRKQTQIEYLENRLRFLIAQATVNGDVETIRLLGKVRTMLYSGNTSRAEKLINEIEKNLATPSNSKKRTNKTIENSRTEDEITVVDASNDPSVSFKYPTKIPADSSLLFIASHERQHVQDIIGRAILEGRIAQVYVRYFTSYDSQGRLIFTGGYTWGKIINYSA